jgi:hypothetical protein
MSEAADVIDQVLPKAGYTFPRPAGDGFQFWEQFLDEEEGAVIDPQRYIAVAAANKERNGRIDLLSLRRARGAWRLRTLAAGFGLPWSVVPLGDFLLVGGENARRSRVQVINPDGRVVTTADADYVAPLDKNGWNAGHLRLLADDAGPS